MHIVIATFGIIVLLLGLTMLLISELSILNTSSTETRTTTKVTTTTLTVPTKCEECIPLRIVHFKNLIPLKTPLPTIDLLRIYQIIIYDSSCWFLKEEYRDVGFPTRSFINPFAPPPTIDTGKGMLLDKYSNQSLPPNILVPLGCNLEFAYFEEATWYNPDLSPPGLDVISGGKYVTLSAPRIYTDGTVYIEVDVESGPLAGVGRWYNLTKIADDTWKIVDRGTRWVA